MPALKLDDIKQRVLRLANQICLAQGVDLIDIHIKACKSDWVIQILADKPSGGITIQECAIINKFVVEEIGKENFLTREIFSLEVSSPGLDRPLVTCGDFRRCIGKRVHFWFKENPEVRWRKEEEGILSEVGESQVTIESGNQKIVVPLSFIIKGILVI